MKRMTHSANLEQNNEIVIIAVNNCALDSYNVIKNRNQTSVQEAIG